MENGMSKTNMINLKQLHGKYYGLSYLNFNDSSFNAIGGATFPKPHSTCQNEQRMGTFLALWGYQKTTSI